MPGCGYTVKLPLGLLRNGKHQEIMCAFCCISRIFLRLAVYTIFLPGDLRRKRHTLTQVAHFMLYFVMKISL